MAAKDRVYPLRDVKLLWGRAASSCAFPECEKECIEPKTDTDREAVTGIIGHIYAHADNGPRGKPTLTPEERDCYENWILLCSEHHIIVDKQPNTYTSADLFGWKEAHEQKVRELLQKAMPGVSFAELEIVAKAILHNPGSSSTSFRVTPPKEKMEKNGLSQPSQFVLTLAFGGAKEVGRFVRSMSKIDYQYPERLKAGFTEEYNRLLGEGFAGDSLFAGMEDFATRGFSTFDLKSAGLAVLGYFFEKCEIFEP